MVMSRILRYLFPNRVWERNGSAVSYKPYKELPEESQKAIRTILGVKRFTTSVSPFEYCSCGKWRNSLQFDVPGDFRSFPPFTYDDPNYPGLAKTLREAYDERIGSYD